MVCGLGYRHFSTRTPNRLLSAGGKMWILGRRRPVRCNAPDSLAGQALRIGGALLIGAGMERSAGGIIASEQPALVAEAQSSVGKLNEPSPGSARNGSVGRVVGSWRIRFLKVTVLSL